jgi:hypothetical protein
MPAKRRRNSNGSSAVSQNGHANAHANGGRFAAAPDVNDDPDRVKFAYWVPNVSGGLVISKIPQRTKCVILSMTKAFPLTNI